VLAFRDLGCARAGLEASLAGLASSGPAQHLGYQEREHEQVGVRRGDVPVMNDSAMPIRQAAEHRAGQRANPADHGA